MDPSCTVVRCIQKKSGIYRTKLAIHYSGNPSQCLAVTPRSYQEARSAQKILSLGVILGSASREPAGTISALPFLVTKGRSALSAKHHGEIPSGKVNFFT